MITSLSKQDVLAEVEIRRKRRVEIADIICGTIATVAGIVQLVAQMVFSILALSSLKYEEVPCPTDNRHHIPNPEHHHRAVVDQDVHKLFLGSLGISTFIATAPITGFLAYGICMAVAWFFAIRPLENLKEKIQEYKTELIQAEDIKQFLSMGDEEFIKNLLKKMDFEQLYQAHKELGDKNFKKLNENPAWNLKDQVNEENVNQYKAQLIAEPYFFKAVEERASGKFKMSLNSMCIGLSTEDPTQNLSVNGRDLFNYSFCLVGNETDVIELDSKVKSLLNSNISVVNKHISEILSIVDLSDDLKKLLNGDISVLNDQTAISLLDKADRWSLVNVISIIDSYLNLHRSSFSEDLLIDLIDLYPGLDKIRTSISKKYLKHKEIVSEKVQNLVLTKEDFELFDRSTIVSFLKNYCWVAISSNNEKMKNNAMKVIKKEMEKERLPSAQLHDFNLLYHKIVNGVHP